MKVKGKTAKERKELDRLIAAREGESVETLVDLPADGSNVMERILWVRDRVTRLGKDASVGGQYKAITHDKVTAFIRPKMVQAGIFSFMTSVEATDAETGMVGKTGRKVMQHRAVFEIRFVNAEDATDFVIVRQVAYADDQGDKAPGKAASYAMKYALLKTFMIETGEDDEEREEGNEQRGATIQDDETMLADLWAVAEECFGEDAKSMLAAMAKRRFFVDNYGEIPQDRYADAVRSLRVKAAQEDSK